MKKIMLISCLALGMACSGNSERAESDNTEVEAEENVDVGAGEDISPQLELDSSEQRFEVDTVSSPAEIKEEAGDESF